MLPPTVQPPKKKKEKPLVKKPIPGTEWLRVTTTEGNTFYTHKGKKESVWIAPEEIKEALLELERAEAHEAEQARLEQQEKEAEASAKKIEREREEEVDRIKAEVQGLVKRRKRGELEPLDEVVITKKARVEDDVEEDEDEESENQEEDEESESDEDWQKEAAAQLAAEAEEEQKRREEEAKRVNEAEQAEKRAQEKQSLSMPDRVDLSLDEAKALFKVYSLHQYHYSDIHKYRRHSCERRISTPCILGIPLYRSLSLTPDMYSSPLSQHAMTLSMNTAEIVLASCDKKTSGRKEHKQIPKRNLTLCSTRK